MNKNHDADDHDSEHYTRLRWCIGAARYAVAALVTVITVAVIARAVAVSVRSEKLYIQVANGTVSVVGFSTSPNQVKLLITLVSYNPSGRVGLNYTGVNISLFDNNRSLITSFLVKDGINGIMVGPDITRRTIVRATQDVPADVSQDFVDRMHNGTPVTNATVHLHGTLQTQISGDMYTHGHTTQFSCYPVIIGREDQLTASDDVSCN